MLAGSSFPILYQKDRRPPALGGAMDESPISSAISERPGPEVAVIDFTPVKEAPITAPIAASSSSVCSDEPPIFGSHSLRKWRISDDGVIG